MANFIKRIILLLAFPTIGSCTHQLQHCTDDWGITGFYTPIEKEFSSKTLIQIDVKETGTLSFNAEFLREVRMEGWGKTRFGWYLGYYNNQWHKSDFPLNASGTALKIGAIAVDNNVIPRNSRITIPSLSKYLNVTEFIAVDVGSKIKNNRIDVYTGEGNTAKQKTFFVTGNREVCTIDRHYASVEDLSRRN